MKNTVLSLGFGLMAIVLVVVVGFSLIHDNNPLEHQHLTGFFVLCSIAGVFIFLSGRLSGSGTALTAGDCLYNGQTIRVIAYVQGRVEDSKTTHHLLVALTPDKVRYVTVEGMTTGKFVPTYYYQYLSGLFVPLSIGRQG